MKLVNLKVNNRIRPVGIGKGSIKFSWQMEAEGNDHNQKAYQIKVWEKNSEKVMYDSGKVTSDSAVAVPYHGEELTPKTEYGFEVIIWNENNEQIKAESEFETTLFDESDWIAEFAEPSVPLPQLEKNPYDTLEEIWEKLQYTMVESNDAYHNIKTMPNDDVKMAGGIDLDKTAAPYKSQIGEGPALFQETMNLPWQPYDPVLRIRKVFNLKDKIQKGRLYITAHGIYHVLINGKEVTDNQFEPGFTSYESMLAFQTYDVTEFLKDGENVIAIEVGDGWYKGKIALGRGNDYGSVPGILFQLEADNCTIVSDEECMYSFEGPIRYSDIFKGEKYDARMEQIDWDKPFYDSSDWKSMSNVKTDKSILFPDLVDGVKAFEVVSCKEIIKTPAGETVLDFGQNMAGRVRMKVEGPVGCEVVLEHGESLSKEGNFFFAYGMPTSEQVDYYILSGEGLEEYEPRFTFHGFRYVKISGYPNEVKKENFIAVALSSDCEETGDFKCSNPDLNQLQHNIRWSQRSNIFSIPTDCPQRERAGWTGDVWIYGETACYNQDLYNFFRKWLKNIRHNQSENGMVPAVVPTLRSYPHTNSMGSTGWADVIVKLPYQMYHIYGDKQILEENYEAMKSWVNYGAEEAYTYMPRGLGYCTIRQLENQHYLWNTGFHFGDWLVPSIKDKNGFSDGVKSSFITMEYMATMVLADSLQMIAEVANLLGRKEDEEKYRKLNNRIKEAFAEEYITSEGKLKTSLQGIYILALKFHMVPETHKQAFVKELVRLIHENDDRLHTGFLSVPYILDVLCDNGEEELATTILYQDKCPSWLYEVKHGATTMWEAWDAINEDGEVGGCSFNHYAFGCVGNYLYQKLAGIQHGTPGYKEIIIAPKFNCGLVEVEGSYESVYGKIVSEWKKKDKGYNLSIKTPANTNFKLKIMNTAFSKITINGKLYDMHEGENEFELGNGKYHAIIE